MSAEHVTVRIYGETYPLKTGEDASYVAEIAQYVDTGMREVAASGKVVVTSKIAVLAALHIADELFRQRKERNLDEIKSRINRLTDALERALEDSASKT